MRGALGAARTLSNFKPIDIFEYAEPGEPKGMGRWPDDLVDQPRRAGPHAGTVGRCKRRSHLATKHSRLALLGGVGSQAGISGWYIIAPHAKSS